MGFRTGAYATVWETKEGNGNWTDVRLSISRKNREGDYETDFSGFVRFIGEASTKAQNLGDRARIKIGECDVTNRYDKEKGVTYTNFAVFNFEEADGNSEASSGIVTTAEGFIDIPDGIDDELPFA